MANSHISVAKEISRNALVNTDTKRLLYFLTKRSAPNFAFVPADITALVGTTLTASADLVLRDSVYNGGFALQGGNKYFVQGELFVTPDAAGGLKYDFGASSATFGNINILSELLTATVNTNAILTSTTGTHAATSLVLVAKFKGTMECSGSGTLAVRYAENASGTGVVLKRGSWMSVTDLAQS